MSAVSKRVMPRSSALCTTLREASRSMRPPKLVQPSPTSETSRPDFPRLRCFTVMSFRYVRRSTQQCFCMMAEVVVDEVGDEIIGVVVALVPAQAELLVRVAAGRLEELGAKLLGEEFVGEALIDKNLAGEWRAGDEGGRVIVEPGGAVGAEIPPRRLLSPRHLAR